MNDETTLETPVVKRARKGFLPIPTNWFDRLFIGLMGHVGLNLLWLRFLEQSVPLIVGTLIGLVWIVVVLLWG